MKLNINDRVCLLVVNLMVIFHAVLELLLITSILHTRMLISIFPSKPASVDYKFIFCMFWQHETELTASLTMSLTTSLTVPLTVSLSVSLDRRIYSNLEEE